MGAINYLERTEVALAMLNNANVAAILDIGRRIVTRKVVFES
jgi:hypothetical protein